LTTTREYIEDENFAYWIINKFVKRKGQVPLCHVDLRKKKGEPLELTCAWQRKQNKRKKYFTLEEFRPLCLKCQEEIEKKIKEWDAIYNES
jgi:hypothetical protein